MGIDSTMSTVEEASRRLEDESRRLLFYSLTWLQIDLMNFILNYSDRVDTLSIRHNHINYRRP